MKTIPVRCLHNHCQNRGVCYVDLLRNLTQCVCPAGKRNRGLTIVDWMIVSILQVLLVINVNIQSMNVNPVHVQNIVIVLIYRIVTPVFVVGERDEDQEDEERLV